LLKGLGWEPKYGLVDGLGSAYGWYLKIYSWPKSTIFSEAELIKWLI
jgi:dTDP-D-glucose 4,6-dehydratase